MSTEQFDTTLGVDRGTTEPAMIVDVEGFEGPLDLLLMLARQQKVDLAKISILALADQYLSFIEAARQLRMELAADYLVMAGISEIAAAAARSGFRRRAERGGHGAGIGPSSTPARGNSRRCSADDGPASAQPGYFSAWLSRAYRGDQAAGMVGNAV